MIKQELKEILIKARDKALDASFQGEKGDEESEKYARNALYLLNFIINAMEE